MLIISIFILQKALNSGSDCVYVVYFCCEPLNPDLITWDKHKCLQWLAFNGHSEYLHTKHYFGLCLQHNFISEESAINYLCKLFYCNRKICQWLDCNRHTIKEGGKRKRGSLRCCAVLFLHLWHSTAQFEHIPPAWDAPHEGKTWAALALTNLAVYTNSTAYDYWVSLKIIVYYKARWESLGLTQ